MICKFCGCKFDKNYDSLTEDYFKVFIPKCFNGYICNECTEKITELIKTKTFNDILIKRLKKENDLFKKKGHEALFDELSTLTFQSNITPDTTIDDIHNIGIDDEAAIRDLQFNEKKLMLYKNLYRCINPKEYFECEACHYFFHKKLMYYCYDFDDDGDDFDDDGDDFDDDGGDSKGAGGLVCYSCKKVLAKERREDIKDFYEDFDPDYEISDAPRPLIAVRIKNQKAKMFFANLFAILFLLFSIFTYYISSEYYYSYLLAIIPLCFGLFISDSILRLKFSENIYLTLIKKSARILKLLNSKLNGESSIPGLFVLILFIPYVLLWVLLPLYSFIIALIISPIMYIVDSIRLLIYYRRAMKSYKEWYKAIKINIDFLI